MFSLPPQYDVITRCLACNRVQQVPLSTLCLLCQWDHFPHLTSVTFVEFWDPHFQETRQSNGRASSCSAAVSPHPPTSTTHTSNPPTASHLPQKEASKGPCRLQGLPASSLPCPPLPVAHVGLQPQQPSNLSQDSNICCPLCLAGTSFLLPASPSLPSFRSLLQCPFLGETCPDTPTRAPCDNTPHHSGKH